MIVEINKLRKLSEQCLANERLDPELANWLGDALHGYLCRRYRTVEEALGLRFPQGGVPWWREEAIRRRDAVLRRMAERFFAELSPTAQAKKIWTITSRYAASAWRFDRDRSEPPTTYRGTVKEFVWTAFDSGATMPICERQLRNILGR